MNGEIKSKNRRKNVLLVFGLIFFALAVTAFVFYMIMAVNFFQYSAIEGSGEGVGEQLGIGLSLAFSVVFMIIFGAAEAALSLISIPLFVFLFRLREGKSEVVGKALLILNAVIVLATVALFVAALIVNGG